MASRSTGSMPDPVRPAFSSVTSASFSMSPSAARRLAQYWGMTVTGWMTKLQRLVKISTVPAVMSPRMARKAPRKKMPNCKISEHRFWLTAVSRYSHQQRRRFWSSRSRLASSKRRRASSSALKLLMTEKPASRSLSRETKRSFLPLTAFSRAASSPPISRDAARGRAVSRMVAAARKGLYQNIMARDPKKSRTAWRRRKERLR